MLELLLRNMLWAAWWPYSTMLLALEKAARQQEGVPAHQASQRERAREEQETSMRPDAFMQPDIPEPLREIMKLSLEQTRRAFETFVATSEKAWKSIENANPPGRADLFALNNKIVEIARKNAEANFMLAASLIEAKDLRQAIELLSHHAKTQMETFVRQLEEMRDLAMQMIRETSPAAQTDISGGRSAPPAGNNMRGGPAKPSFASYAPSSSVTPGSPGRGY